MLARVLDVWVGLEVVKHGKGKGLRQVGRDVDLGDTMVKRLDHAWRLVRRAAGHPQVEGVVERVFVISAGIAVVIFSFWFLIIAGPGPQVAPWR